MKLEGRSKLFHLLSRARPDRLAAFIITGGLGAIGGATAREITSKGGYAAVSDVCCVGSSSWR